MDALEYKAQWLFAKEKARQLMNEFGIDSNNAIELNVIAMSFMEGFGYALLYQATEKGKDEQKREVNRNGCGR